jgi:two-component sensor histidine kinase
MDAGTQPSAQARFDFARIARPIVFALVAASILGTVLLIFQTIEAERGVRAQAERTSAVLAELDTINRAVLNAETGQRGYLLSLDRRYLAPYLTASARYRPALDRLRELLGPDLTARQGQLLTEVENLTLSKFGEMSDSVALIERGEVLEARTRILTDEGQEVMDRLRRAVRELEAIETEQLARASGETARAEGRVLPLLAALFALLLVALVLGYGLVRRAARAEAEASQASALAEARDRADLLARELNHRVKNLFAVILAIVRMSGKDAPADARPVVDRIAERIHALLAAHEVTQGQAGSGVASLRALIETAIKPYLSSERKAALEGPEVQLSGRQVTPLGLVLHELTTNAVKYGCWSSGGLLKVDWRTNDGELAIDWREEHPGSGLPSERTGFGSLLMTSAARQLRGSIERRFTSEGVHVAMRMPLEGSGQLASDRADP